MGNPRAVWSLFYNMQLCSADQEVLVGTPTNLYITSDPTSKIVYDEAVTEVSCVCHVLTTVRYSSLF